MLRIVAQHADIWNVMANTVEEFKHKNAVLLEHCQTIGRDPESIVRSKIFMIQPENPKQALAEIQSYIEAGLQHVVLNSQSYQEESLPRVVEELILPLRNVKV